MADDEEREKRRRRNDGSGKNITPEAINFMATHGRGLICLVM
jgi:3,4-dihydroxy-2-butanone 4-phosphate synthase